MTGEKIPAAEPVEALAFGDGESVIGGGRGSIEIQTWEDGEVSVFVCDNGVQGQGFALLADEAIQLARALQRLLPDRTPAPGASGEAIQVERIELTDDDRRRLTIRLPRLPQPEPSRDRDER